MTLRPLNRPPIIASLAISFALGSARQAMAGHVCHRVELINESEMHIEGVGGTECGSGAYWDGVTYYDPSLPEPPDPIPAPPDKVYITLRTWHMIDQCHINPLACDLDCYPDPATITVFLYDCNGDIIDTEAQNTFVLPLPNTNHPQKIECPEDDPDGCSSSSAYTDHTFVFDLPEWPECRFPKNYRVEGQDRCRNLEAGPSCGANFVGNVPLPLEREVCTTPPPLDCSATREDLECYAGCKPHPVTGEIDCGTGCGFSITDDFLRYHKSTDTLWTLRQKGNSGATWGEVVNGEFRAKVKEGDPQRFLYVYSEIVAEGGSTLSSSDVVDTFGSPGADQPGWYVDWQNRGTEFTAGSRCMSIQNGSRFEFNVRAGRSNNPPDLRLSFYVYDREAWLPGYCCALIQRRIVDIDVKPRPCVLEASEPLVPKLQVLQLLSGGDGPIELRLHCCPPPGCGGNANLSEPFIAWPTPNGYRIRQGFARGWTIFDDPASGQVTLTSPGDDPDVYTFDRPGGAP